MSGLGWLFRDHTGVFFTSPSKAGGKALAAEIVELMSAQWEAGFRDVIFEGDNISVMNAIHSSEVELSSGGAIVANVLHVDLSYNMMNFSFVKR